MKHDEIMQLARKCFTSAEYPVLEHEAEKFAKLVAEKEREACARLCESIGVNTEVEMISRAFADHIRARSGK